MIIKWAAVRRIGLVFLLRPSYLMIYFLLNATDCWLMNLLYLCFMGMSPKIAMIATGTGGTSTLRWHFWVKGSHCIAYFHHLYHEKNRKNIKKCVFWSYFSYENSSALSCQAADSAVSWRISHSGWQSRRSYQCLVQKSFYWLWLNSVLELQVCLELNRLELHNHLFSSSFSILFVVGL